MRYNSTFILSALVIAVSIVSPVVVEGQQVFDNGIRVNGKYSQNSNSIFQIDAPNIEGGRFRISQYSDGRACFGCTSEPIGKLDIEGLGWVHFNNFIATTPLSVPDDPTASFPGGPTGMRFTNLPGYRQGVAIATNRTIGTSYISYSNNPVGGPGAGLPATLQIGKPDGGNVNFLPELTLQNGKLGLGVTAPLGRLDVSGSGWVHFKNDIADEAVPAHRFGIALGHKTESGVSYLSYASMDLESQGVRPSLQIGRSSPYEFNAEMTLKDGKVGIFHNNPSATLHVNGTSIFEDAVTFKKAPAFTDLNVKGTSTFENTTFSGAVTFNSTPTFAGGFSAGAITTQNSKVGISQAQPRGVLDVGGNGWTYVNNNVGDLVPEYNTGLALGYRSAGAAMIVYPGQDIVEQGAPGSGPGGVTPIASITKQCLEFGSASANNGYISEMTLKGGNLGIGTADPQARLHVNGTSTFEDAVTFRKSTTFTEGIKLNSMGIGVTDPKFVLPATLYVNGTSTFEDAVTFKNATTFTQGINLTSLTVNGASTFEQVVTFKQAPVFSQGISVSSLSSNTLAVATTAPKGNFHVGTTALVNGSGAANWSYLEGNVQQSKPDASVKQGLAFGWNMSGGNGESIVSYNKGLGTTPRLDFSSWNPTNGTYTTEMTLKDGRVGVGTTTPGSALEVNGDITLRNGTGSRKQIFTFSPTDNNWRIGMNLDPGFTRSLCQSYVQYLTYSSAVGHGFAVGVNGGQSSFEVRGSDHSAYFRGNVNVGTTVLDAAYKLSVGGKVRANEIVLESDWADFVFDDDHKLRTIYEVEEFIQKNGHLPDVPSAAEVKEKGLSVSEMQTVMMQKIEELTLYVIELQKQNDELKSQVKSQSK